MKRSKLFLSLCGIAAVGLLGIVTPFKAHAAGTHPFQATTAQKASTSEIKELLRQARDFYDEGKLDEALITIRKALEQSPHNVAAHQLYVKICLARTSNPVLVADEYRAKMAAEPKNPLYPLIFGLTPLLTYDTQEGPGFLTKVMELAPDWSWSQVAAGELKKAQKDIEGAVAAYRQAAALDPTETIIQQGFARLLIEAKQFDEAITVCQKLIQSNPKGYSLYRDLWKAQAAKSGNDAAVLQQIETDLARLLATEEKNPRLLQIAAFTYEQPLSQKEKALGFQTELNKMYPGWGKMDSLGYVEMDNQTGLRRRYFFLGHRFRYNERRVAALQLKDKAQQVAALEALDTEPLDDEFRVLVNENLLEAYDGSDIGKMEAAAAKVIKLDPEDIGVYKFVINALLERKGDLNRARKHAQMLVAATETYTPATRPASFDPAAWAQNFPEGRARFTYRNRRAEYLYALGRVQLALGEYAPAEESFRKAEVPDNDPTWGGIPYHYGLTLEKLGKTRAAAELYARIMAQYGDGTEKISSKDHEIKHFGGKAAEALTDLEKRNPTLKSEEFISQANQQKREEVAARVRKRFISAEPKDFSLTSLDGKPYRLADLRGKVVVMNFWSTWCGPCMAELPHLKKLYETYKSQGVEFLSMNTWDEQDVAKEFLAREKMPFPVFWAEAVAKQYGVSGIPQTFFFGRDGKLRYQASGFSWYESKFELNAVMEELVKEK
ncbi:MAG: redoxin domain-containing protein [Blastocatellia bacterium]|nr:redoxin domain-containing protein [Blastocatellia bacterium]